MVKGRLQIMREYQYEKFCFLLAESIAVFKLSAGLKYSCTVNQILQNVFSVTIMYKNLDIC